MRLKLGIIILLPIVLLMRLGVHIRPSLRLEGQQEGEGLRQEETDMGRVYGEGESSTEAVEVLVTRETDLRRADGQQEEHPEHPSGHGAGDVTEPADLTNVYYYYRSYPTQWQMYSGYTVQGAPAAKDQKSQDYIIEQIPYNQLLHLKGECTSFEKRGRSTLFLC